MATSGTVVPIVSVLKSNIKSNNGVHECARCFNPATTRCSRCKTVRYCSGKCQIIHWRQVHKQECQLLEVTNGCSNEDFVSLSENSDSRCSESNIELNGHEKAPLNDSSEKRSIRCKSNMEVSRREDVCSTSYNNTPSKETFIRHKPKRSHIAFSKEVIQEKNDTSESVTHEGNMVKSRSHFSGSKPHKSGKSTMDVSRDQTFSGSEDPGESAVDDLYILQKKDAKGIINKGFMKMIGLKKSTKHSRVETSEVNGDKHKKIKMLFPYEEFLKYFQYQFFDFSPRGLVNCGNSCYANAVVQCLMSTKPLTIYLLHRSHSRTCYAKSWCLMCELEHHVMMLQESGEPLSLSNILLNMRGVNFQIGDGSQEDAHEFLRVLITSMQSICLEGLGGEDVVDPKLQETTFVQHTFGGQLRSRVKCMRCHHESDRYENIMDLTLEIFGWVESLEDALTQFTSPEELDGENMYRCGRCATYVRARKQLAIHEAPNILTIVLKRFQEGSYGKLNKCITYPEMLDMIPFMTGKDDIPPLYMLYGVVVHLDTMNASFSGHYVSYVKDLQGNWSRIDDAQVHRVPLSQVMSEGAYILFYMRSTPRLPRSYTLKPSKHQASTFSKSKPPKSTQECPNRNHHNYSKPSNIDISDATSDWSIFTSSDDASFTTESTRDSFSTVDYTDYTPDPFSSIFNTLYTHHDHLPHNTVSCSRFSSRAHTRFMEEEKRAVVKAYDSGNPPYRLGNTERHAVI
ncbi:hypothetical protein L2E82_02305 [Cichorium intybus]|uniref:Uncharacterized protein n=1 Tax=Cichorium intybus TaxID=13427 RepID=A0ACB9H2K6_CICIN|nr:hypothetical protein L2E82_02305 [Cichorium intybus]